MTVLRFDGSSIFSGVDFEKDLTLISTGPQSLQFNPSYTFGGAAGAVVSWLFDGLTTVEADIGVGYEFDFGFYVDFEIGPDQLDIAYDVEFDTYVQDRVAVGDRFVVSVLDWDVTNVTLNHVFDVNTVEFDVGVFYDFDLDVTQLGFSSAFYDIDLFSEIDAIDTGYQQESLLSLGVGGGGIDLSGVLGDLISTDAPNVLEGELSVPWVPGASLVWDFNNIAVTNSETKAAETAFDPFSQFDFTSSSEDTQAIFGANLDIDDLLAAFVPALRSPTNPLESIFNYSFELFDKFRAIASFLDIDVTFGPELRRETTFHVTDTVANVYQDGTLVGSGDFGSTIRVTNPAAEGITTTYDVEYVVEGQYEQTFFLDFGFDIFLEALAFEIGRGEVEYERRADGLLEPGLSGFSLQYDGIDLFDLAFGTNDIVKLGSLELGSWVSDVSLISEDGEAFDVASVSAEEARLFPDLTSAIDPTDPDFDDTVTSGDQEFTVEMQHSSTVVAQSLDAGDGYDTVWLRRTDFFNTGMNARYQDDLGFVRTITFNSNASLVEGLLSHVANGGNWSYRINNATYSFTGVEAVNVQVEGVGNRPLDVIIGVGGTRYDGGDGSDLFIADWRDQDVAINWDVSSSGPQDLGNGVSVANVERVILWLGDGDDAVSVGGNERRAPHYIDAGNGADTLRTTSTMGDTLIGGGGDDTLFADMRQIGGGQNTTLDGGADFDTAWLRRTDSWTGAMTALYQDSLGFDRTITFGTSGTLALGFMNHLTAGGGWFYKIDTSYYSIYGIEAVNVQGSDSSDVIVAHGGTRYDGAGGNDLFLTDLRHELVGITWDSTASGAQALGNGMQVANVERVVAWLGQGNDTLTLGYSGDADHGHYIDGGDGDDTIMSRNNFNDILLGGAGNDHFHLNAQYSSAARSARVEGGANTDTIWITGIYGSPIRSMDVRYQDNLGFVRSLDSYSTATSVLAFLSHLEAGGDWSYLLGKAAYGFVGIEAINVTGSVGPDVIVGFGGTNYSGGGNDDLFIADWSAQTDDVTWAVTANGPQDLGNGVTVADVERVIVTLGSGDDVIAVGRSDLYYTGHYIDGGFGDDTIISRGNFNDVLIGGAGDDVFFIDANYRNFENFPTAIHGGVDNDTVVLTRTDTSAYAMVALYEVSGFTRTIGYTVSNSDFLTFMSFLNDGGDWGYRINNNRYAFSEIEAFDITGSDGSDVIVGFGGESYDGGGGSDLFLADWSDQAVGISWDVSSDGPQDIGNGVFVSEMERVMLRLGSGDDTIKLAYSGVFDSGSFVDAGAGNDIIVSTTGYDHTLIGGAGNDLIVAAGIYETVIFEDDFGSDQVFNGTFGGTLEFIDNRLASLAFERFEDHLVITGHGSSNRVVLHDYWLDPDEWNVRLNGSDVILVPTSIDEVLVPLVLRDNPLFETVPQTRVSLAATGEQVFVATNIAHHVVGTSTAEAIDYAESDAGVSIDFRTGWGSGGFADGDTFENIEAMRGSAFADLFIGDDQNNYIIGDAGDDAIYGGGGDDFLSGGAGNDRIVGNDGFDNLEGGAGDDILKSKSGASQIDAGEGNDRVIGSDDTDSVLGGAGADVIATLGGDDLIVAGDGGDFAYGGRGNDKLEGGAGADTLRGNRGFDELDGGAGNDDIRGGSNDDVLIGSSGDDYLLGENHRDTINGGAGNDVMVGARGSGDRDGWRDVFVYEGTLQSGGGFDRIRDFEDGIDVVDLSAFGFVDFTTEVLALATDRGAGLRVDFGGGDVLFFEDFLKADFDADDVILS